MGINGDNGSVRPPSPGALPPTEGQGGERTSDVSSLSIAVQSFIKAEDGNPNHFYLGKGEIQGWRRMLFVDRSLRSWLSGTMIYIETTLDFIEKLAIEDVTQELQKKLPLVSMMLEEIVQDLKSPYLDNGSLSLLALERIQNLLFRDRSGSMLRLNINMTDANKVDTSGNLGTAYKRAILEWLQNEFGERHISLNPEGSSFLAINVSRHEISCSLGRFAREIPYRLRNPEMYERYEFDPRLLKQFTPSATGMFMTVDTSGLEIEETLETLDSPAILDLQTRIIARIEESLRILAVGSTLAEKDPASIGFASGLSVYEADALPGEGEAGYDTFMDSMKLGMGYVPPSVYRSQYIKGTPTVDEEFERHPRYGHDFGRLDHPERDDTPGGGALQMLQKRLLALSIARDEQEKDYALAKLKVAAKDFSYALDIGRISRSNPRNPAFVKWMQEVKLSDGSHLMDPYFIERVALRREENVHLAVVEIDSFKAFTNRYGVDGVDSQFWGVFEPFFSLAKDWGIDQPLLTQIAGDLVAIALPTQNSGGSPVDIDEYVREVQSRITAAYGNKPFQDTKKVKVKNGGIGHKIERWPLWQKGNAVIPKKDQPKGAEQFQTTLTITAVATTAPTPRTNADMKVWIHNINEMAARFDPLKEVTPNKGQYESYPFSQTEKAPEPQKSFSGVYRVSPGERRDLVTERFMESIDSQLEEAWGEDWTTMDPALRAQFINLLKQRAESSPAILTPDDVVDVVAAMSGAGLAQFPPAPVLFMPLLAGAII